MPVASDVIAHAAARPDVTALRSPDRVRTYGQLAAAAEDVAVALAKLGAGPGRLVAVDLADPVELLTAILAVDLTGATPLVCDAAWSAEQRAAVRRAVQPDLCVDAWPLGTRAVTSSVTAAGDVTCVATSVGGRHHTAADDLAWAGFSSGSTGRPRAVVRTRSSWTASYSAIARLTGLTHEDTVLVPGPLASSLYCFAALHGLATGASVTVTGRWSPRLVRRYLAEADVVHLVPPLLPHVLDQLATTSATRLRTAVVGGAALPGGLRERASAAGMDVVAYYGAVELSFVAVDLDGHGLRPFDGVEVDVRPLPGSCVVGEVWVRSPWLADGYLAGATGPFRRDRYGWATVGDLAEIGPHQAAGRLRLRGRGDGAVVTGGATVVPEDVEAVLAGVPGVSDVVVVGTPHHHLGAVVTAVIETGGAPVPRQLLESAARDQLSAAQRPRRWFEVDRLPRTGSGKPARAVVAERLSSGALDARPVRWS